MSFKAHDLLGENPVAKNISEWLREYSAKELANMFGASERTAKGWRDGNMPQNTHLIAMAERWGLNFLEDVFAPVLGTNISDAQRIERIEHDLHALRESRAKVRSIISLFLVLFSTFGAILDGEPIVRAPRPTPTKTRREIT